jgi:hypothetical protein
VLEITFDAEATEALNVSAVVREGASIMILPSGRICKAGVLNFWMT